MPLDSTQPGQGYGLFIGIGLALMIVLWRNRRARKLRVELLWIRPAILFGLLIASAIVSPPPFTASSVASLGAAALIGAALGWQRGRFMRIEVDPETHEVTSRASPLGIIFIFALLALRAFLARATLEGGVDLPVAPAIVTSALLVLAGVMLATQGLEMWLRARRLLAEARTRSTSGSAPLVS